MDTKEMGKRIQQKRKMANMTQEALADQIQVTVNQLYYIETGQRSPSVEVLVKISRALEASIDELAFGKDFIEPDSFGHLLKDSSPQERWFYYNVISSAKLLLRNLD